MNHIFTHVKRLFILIFCFTTLLLSLWDKNGFAQGIPPGKCGVQFTYDASGNQVSRQYICNNIQPEVLATRSAEVPMVSSDNSAGESVIIVEAKVIYPNPTTEILNIHLFKAIENGTISVLDLAGKVVWQQVRQGDRLVLDLSALQKGNYILRIVDIATKTDITQNIIKL